MIRLITYFLAITFVIYPIQLIAFIIIINISQSQKDEVIERLSSYSNEE